VEDLEGGEWLLRGWILQEPLSQHGTGRCSPTTKQQKQRWMVTLNNHLAGTYVRTVKRTIRSLYQKKDMIESSVPFVTQDIDSRMILQIKIRPSFHSVVKSGIYSQSTAVGKMINFSSTRRPKMTCYPTHTMHRHQRISTIVHVHPAHQ
jgi:hypothetical protein